MEWATAPKAAGGYALHVCEVCKRRKRKCDRRLPQCSLCANSKHRACRYSDPCDPPSGDTSRAVSLSELSPQKIPFPSVYFLDHDIFEKSRIEITNSSPPFSLQLMGLLGSSSKIRGITSRYFDQIHPFMPIISKKQFYERHLSPLATPKADVLLLCLCMKIFTWEPSETTTDLKTPDYLTAKHFVTEIEAAGIFTLQVLQASVLIAIYELGHGIYPSLNLTISSCATRAIALDLENELTEHTSSRFTWVEQEERRRVWWAVIILERVASLGWPSRPLITKDPTSQDLLPVDDSLWDMGVITKNHPIHLLTTTDADMGRYGRLALSTYLLCCVFKHKSEQFSHISIQAEESLQLHRTLQAAITLCDLEGERRDFTCCSPVDICRSALLILHSTCDTSTALSSSCESDTYDSDMAWQIARSIVASSQTFLGSGPRAFKQVSPLALHSVYKAATVYIRKNQRSLNKESLEGLETLKAALRVKNQIWRVAGEYSRILDAREAMRTL